MTYQIKGGKWVILYCDSTVDSFYYEIAVVHRGHVQDGCILLELLLLLLFIFGGKGKKFYVLTKCVKKNTFLFSLGIFQ